MSPSSLVLLNRPLVLSGGIGLVIVVGYALFAASPYLLGPSVEVLTPAAESTVSTPTVVVSGKTSRVSYVSLNDQPIPLLEDGTFAVERSFPPGYTVLVIRARDRFGREIQSEVRFLNTYNPPRHGTKKEDSGDESEPEGN